MFVDLGKNSFSAGLVVSPHFSFAGSTDNQKVPNCTSAMAKIKSTGKKHSNILSVFIPFRNLLQLPPIGISRFRV